MFNILVVDDDKNIRFVMKEVLEANQYNVFTAKNGEDAFEVMVNEHIDLAIVDIMMPKMDGYEFTEELRNFNQDLPVLMVSAKQLPEDRKKGFMSGIDDFMSKPIDPEELLLHIKALLRRYKIISERQIAFGDVLLDYDSFTVKGHGETIELPQKEFLLLYKLLSFPGKIFTRIQLMDEIWGADCETDAETVTVHIGRLRKRFDGWDDFEIESIRGLGYKAVRNV
ncbi:MAG: response regulator transcription factor [Clostridiales bacterium]|nr:response regulator transcription factor [Clostridiales bacterium]